MGEYARFNGQRVKIGTCEDMYYLRADQIDKVTGYTFRYESIGFRFPFPDEDHVAPGDFHNPSRALGVYGVEPPAELDHSKIQFRALAGILVNLPCPYSSEGRASGVTYLFNGYSGPVRIAQQRAWSGCWATVLACGACNAPYRLETIEDAQPVIDALNTKADGEDRWHAGSGGLWRQVAERIAAGYSTPAPRWENAQVAP